MRALYYAWLHTEVVGSLPTAHKRSLVNLARIERVDEQPDGTAWVCCATHCFAVRETPKEIAELIAHFDQEDVFGVPSTLGTQFGVQS